MKKYFNIKLTNPGEKLEKAMARSKKELDSFFKVDLPTPPVFFLNSRKEIDSLKGRKTESWLVGWTNYGSIFILHPDVYTKESSHKNRDDFWKILKHELCHLYFSHFVKNGRPLWLNEGLACYLSGQENPLPEDIFYIFRYFGCLDKDIYKVGYFWVNLLIEKFGSDKLLKLIKGLKSPIDEKSFAAVFYKVYGLRFNKTGLKKIKFFKRSALHHRGSVKGIKKLSA